MKVTTKIGINGFGRIGRAVFRVINQYHRGDLTVAAINGPDDAGIKAHLIKWDTNYGRFPGSVDVEGDNIIVDGSPVRTYSERDPTKIPWSDSGVEIIIESTGSLKSAEQVAPHFDNGANKVLISNPAKGEDITIVLGVNEERYEPEKHHVISMASCTTNCAAQLAKVLHRNFGIIQGSMTTVHAYTSDQQLLDKNHKDYRRTRAAAGNIVPTTSGGARLIGKVIPELEGKIDGIAFRVPVPVCSLIDFVACLEKVTTVEEVNRAFREAAGGELKGILEYSEEQLVSSDFVGNTASAVFDAPSTMRMGKNMIKVIAWYDNEWGYGCRLAELAGYIAARGL
jgi:glyceraldehyde 3-phosphate dehydrogenase